MKLSKIARAASPFLVLAGCSSSEKPIVPPVAENAEHIACAVNGERDLSNTCAIERVKENGKLMLVVRHPDGAFRRFEVLTDGRGVAVADGAKEAVTTFKDGELDVAVDSDRYVFPATAKPAGQRVGEGDVQ